jgi:hypothetical protein
VNQVVGDAGMIRLPTALSNVHVARGPKAKGTVGERVYRQLLRVLYPRDFSDEYVDLSRT